MIRTSLAVAAFAMMAISGQAHAQAARDQIRIVGSSTVYPFTTAVAEQFGKSSGMKTPVIESTGTGGGMKLFCSGVGANYPDGVNASRRIKISEFETCQKNGVSDIIEYNIGYDGIVVANSRKAPRLSIGLDKLWLALAKEVPDGEGKTKPNPYKTWKEIDPSLPDEKIEVLGPPPTSGTRDSFVELALHGGCKSVGWVKDLEKTDPAKFKKICETVREDGAFIEAGENDNLIVQKLNANSHAFGIFGFSFLEQNMDKLQGSIIGGAEPDFDTIADGKYPISRPMYVYFKKAHIGVIPGIKEFIAEYTSKRASSADGYLAQKGLIPLPAAEWKKWSDKANGLAPLKADDIKG